MRNTAIRLVLRKGHQAHELAINREAIGRPPHGERWTVSISMQAVFRSCRRHISDAKHARNMTSQIIVEQDGMAKVNRHAGEQTSRMF